MKENIKCVVCGVEVDKFQIGHHYKKEHPDFDYNAHKASLKIKICPICGKSFKKGKACPDCREEYYFQRGIAASKLKYKDAPKSSYVVCAICGFHAGNLNSHLSLVHNTNSTEYKDKYNSPTCSDDYLEGCSENIKGDRNPGWQHGGTLSPFSEKFIGTTTKEEALYKVKQTKDANFSYTTRIEYYLHRGYTQEEAEIALKERQTTFSKDICVDKYGEVAGSKIWKDRQKVWQESYNDKSIEEMEIINTKKSNLYIVLQEDFGYDSEMAIELIRSINKESYKRYDKTCRIISEESYKTYVDIIDPNRLRGRECGYDLDHKLSIAIAYIHNINPDVIGSIFNLEVIPSNINIEKNARCSITIEELLNLYKCQQQEILIE